MRLETGFEGGDVRVAVDHAPSSPFGSQKTLVQIAWLHRDRPDALQERVDLIAN